MRAQEHLRFGSLGKDGLAWKMRVMDFGNGKGPVGSTFSIMIDCSMRECRRAFQALWYDVKGWLHCEFVVETLPSFIL